MCRISWNPPAPPLFCPPPSPPPHPAVCLSWSELEPRLIFRPSAQHLCVQVDGRKDSRPGRSGLLCGNAELEIVSTTPPPAVRHLIPDHIPSSPPPHRLLLIFSHFLSLKSEAKRKLEKNPSFVFILHFCFSPPKPQSHSEPFSPQLRNLRTAGRVKQLRTT